MMALDREGSNDISESEREGSTIYSGGNFRE